MGRKNLRLSLYLELWNQFENLLEKNSLDLSSFSKKWENFDHLLFDEKCEKDGTEMTAKKFYDRLRNSKPNEKTSSRVQEKSIEHMQLYIKYLDNNFITQELHHDEDIDNWFD